MAEKCTNTSSPPSCSMKPYPLASLNHFTFPLAIRAASCELRLLLQHFQLPSRVTCAPYIEEPPFFVKQTAESTTSTSVARLQRSLTRGVTAGLPSIRTTIRFAAVPRESLVGRIIAGYTLESE